MKEPSFLGHSGERYLDFVVTKCLSLPELQCTLREIEHLPSGAQVMHIANDDPENLFCLSFRTLPTSSNGVAHILEHTVLCGSRKFPVKDPFFAMNRRSLNTFMNALTGSDFTCYPAASLNEQDFYNLLEVYLDAVFHPELKQFSFLQEGCRLEFTDPKDPKTPLQYKGIVFNEMKGSLANVDTRLWHAMMASLVPDLPYAFNSGGDPKTIPDLSYAELIAFHETYYHPSRCLFFFYGDLPLKKHLDFLTEHTLKAVPKAPPLPPLPQQPRFTQPLRKEMHYPVNDADPLSQRTIVAFGFLTAPLLNQEEVLALSVLDSILMETDASPLKRALLESKLCVQVDALIDSEMSEVPYVLICKGCDAHAVDALEHVLKETLQQIVTHGIPQDLIDAALHQLELSRLEIVGDHAPFGLTLFMRSALAKQHGCSPENTLALHTLFEDLLKKVNEPTYLTGLLRTYLLDNPHTVRLLFHPDPKLSAQENREEKQRLQHVQTHLLPTQITHILEQTEALSKFQKHVEKQSLECLPKVTLKDVSPIARELPLKQIRYKHLTVFHHECFTNHLLYADLCFDLPPIDANDLSYVQLLTTLLTEVGCANRSYADNLRYLQAYTGGLSSSCALHLQTSDSKEARPCFSLHGKSLFRRADKLLSLMKETLLSPRLEEQGRIEELVLQMGEAQRHRLTHQAMRYATSSALSGLSPATYIMDTWQGVRYFQTIQTLCRDLKAQLPLCIETLMRLKTDLFTFHDPHLILSCSKEMFQELKANDFYGLADLPPRKMFTPWRLEYTLPPFTSHARTIASQVAFTVAAFPAVSYLHHHSAALTALSMLLDNLILHRKIREQGGAYGCGASYHATLGYLSFYAYRDPHLASTLATFQEAIQKIAAGKFTPQDLEEAKLGVLQHLDAPISPGHRAMTAYGWWRGGKSLEMRQQFRDRFLDLTPHDIQRAVEMELLPKQGEERVVCFAGKELLDKENALLRSPLPLFSL